MRGALTRAFGAIPTDGGVRFTVFTKHAAALELCLFERPESPRESRRVAFSPGRDGVRSVHVPGLGPGQLYGYRADGPFAPQDGHRFNRSKLLVDPWARAITGEPSPSGALFAYDDPSRPDHSYNSRDSAPAMPKCVVVDPAFDWQGDEPPRTPWRDTVIYECHVRGLTRLHPELDPRLRGTYLGLVRPPVLDHLKSLGITAVELLPVHQIAREPHLMGKGLANYWGYSTLGFFAPHAGYATGGLGQQVSELKTMVRELHRAGIEVILDVVYNHTAEGHHLGPTLSFKGLDNRTFYRLRPRNPRRYEDFTGCGNTLDLRRTVVRELVLSSLRYWVEQMHVDGFRFDLAPALARHDGSGSRSGGAFNPECAFFEAVARDPVLSRVKLIAEPWDLGPGGYRLGHFPEPWAEWNDRYRDGVRRFWRGDPGASGELATRMAGSPDLFGDKGPRRSLHFVACHDGFTLRDMVSYEHKHNEANGEGNRDGHGHNLSRNWGAEGPSGDPRIHEARERARRNLLATVFLSRGVPMLLYGDEIGRTQQGNNNAYCQDNELAWVDWSFASSEKDWLGFVRRLVELRQRFPALLEKPAAWWRPEGVEVKPGDWDAVRAFGMVAPGPRSELVLLVNGHDQEVEFQPAHGSGLWIRLLATNEPRSEEMEVTPPFVLPGYSLQLLERPSRKSCIS